MTTKLACPSIFPTLIRSLETFYTETSEPQPNPTLDIFVYNTTTDDERTQLSRHIVLIPLPFSQSLENDDKVTKSMIFARWGLETFVMLQKRIRTRIYVTTSLIFVQTIRT